MTRYLDTLPCDDQGFLLDSNDWSKALAIDISLREKIDLSPKHWEIIFWARAYYNDFQRSPEMRPFIKYIKTQHMESINSIYILELFPERSIKMISLISGLPKPKSCL
jgi:tRNA 2-thiouridine synthesizing protein E